MKLNPSDFMEHAPDEPGTQVHVDHEGCPEGIDTKKRLYIKRLPDNTVLAYCHHCGLSGYYKEKIRNIHRVAKPSVGEINVLAKDLRLPKDVLKDETRWPITATWWLLKYGITNDEVKKHGIVYSPSIDRLLLPLYMDGDYIGWQGRSLTQNRDVPKYITQVDSNRPDGNCGSYRVGLNQDTAVLVEDIISAIKVSRVVDSIALIGSHPTPEVINWIAKRYKNIFIWLDNDKPEVIKMQNKLHSLFRVLVPGKVKLILTDKDPKEYSTEEIKGYTRL